MTDREGQRRLDAACRVLLVAWLGVAYFTGLASDDATHGDEAYWTVAGYTVASLLLVQHDLSHPFWTSGTAVPILESTNLNAAVNRNPKLGALLIGAPILLSGAPPPHWTLYRFDRSPGWNRRHALIPPLATLFAGRLPVAALGVLAALWFFGVVRTLLPPPAAFAGALLLGLDPLIHLACRRAMLDGPAYAFSVGCVLWTIRACQTPARAAPFALSAGLACAAVSCKLNAGILAPVLAVAFGAEAIVRRSPLPLLRGAIAGAGAALAFVALNPTLYAGPLDGVLAMFRLGGELQGLPAFFPQEALAGPGERARAAAELLLWRYGALRSLAGIPLDAWLLAVGSGILVWRARSAAAARVLLAWLAIAALAVCLWPPVKWDRYFLPALPPIVAAECVAVVVPLRALARAARERLRARPAPRTA